MNINQIKSNLKMNKFYFCNYSFQRDSMVNDGEFDINLTKNIQKIADHTYEVELVTIIEKEDMKLEIVAKAEFIYEAEDYSREESLIETNTVAIMFPFIRSQVSLMTSQPGMTPIVLPAINAKKLIS
ncbi:MAG: protein-export chaperone SecB [Lachnospiraceae bacterium]|nr:protein-export chaperone SecB [Lachnospiraceae bacterium]